MDTIEWSDFEKVALRCGTVIEARSFPEARNPSYLLLIDFGPDIGTLKSSAQITDLYAPEELVGRQVIAVVNLGPKQIGPIRSQCLVTGFPSDNGVVLAVPDKPVANGSKLS
jgi:tRNA-binding protein